MKEYMGKVPDDVWDYLFSFLTSADAILLRNTSKHLRLVATEKRIVKQFQRGLTNVLDSIDFPEDLRTHFNFTFPCKKETWLVPTQIISGGAALAALHFKIFKDGDLDIFVTTEELGLLNTKLQERNFKRDITMQSNRQEGYQVNLTHIRTIATYYHKDYKALKIQLLELKNNEDIRSVINSFDQTAVQIHFDGRTLVNAHQDTLIMKNKLTERYKKIAEAYVGKGKSTADRLKNVIEVMEEHDMFNPSKEKPKMKPVQLCMCCLYYTKVCVCVHMGV